jgi:hypothetical protein
VAWGQVVGRDRVIPSLAMLPLPRKGLGAGRTLVLAGLGTIVDCLTVQLQMGGIMVMGDTVSRDRSRSGIPEYLSLSRVGLERRFTRGEGWGRVVVWAPAGGGTLGRSSLDQNWAIGIRPRWS